MTTTVQDALNLATLVESRKLGAVEVRELSLPEGLRAVDRIVLFCRSVLEQDAELTVDKMLAALRASPEIAVELAAEATNKTKEELLGGLSFAEFLDVMRAFIERNESLVERFLALRDMLEGIRARAVRTP